MRHFTAAEAAQRGRVGVGPVKDGNVIVGALLLRLQVKVGEDQFDAVTRRGGVVPGTVFLVWILFRVVGTGHLCSRTADLKGAAALFAVVLVLMQDKAIIALAQVRANGVPTDVLTSAVIQGTFVFVCDNLRVYVLV